MSNSRRRVGNRQSRVGGFTDEEEDEQANGESFMTQLKIFDAQEIECLM